jgi:hypothetical protein
VAIVRAITIQYQYAFFEKTKNQELVSRLQESDRIEVKYPSNSSSQFSFIKNLLKEYKTPNSKKIAGLVLASLPDNSSVSKIIGEIKNTKRNVKNQLFLSQLSFIQKED